MSFLHGYGMCLDQMRMDVLILDTCTFITFFDFCYWM